MNSIIRLVVSATAILVSSAACSPAATAPAPAPTGIDRARPRRSRPRPLRRPRRSRRQSPARASKQPTLHGRRNGRDQLAAVADRDASGGLGVAPVRRQQRFVEPAGGHGLHRQPRLQHVHESARARPAEPGCAWPDSRGPGRGPRQASRYDRDPSRSSRPRSRDTRRRISSWRSRRACRARRASSTSGRISPGGDWWVQGLNETARIWIIEVDGQRVAFLTHAYAWFRPRSQSRVRDDP